MTRDKIKPILFSIIKHQDPEQLKRQIPRDIVAGIVVAIVALPLSIALAIASGVGPEQGLYTAIVAASSSRYSAAVRCRSRVPPPRSPPSWRASSPRAVGRAW